MSELLPCPFCGAAAEMEPWHGGAPTKQLISCSSEECDASPAVTGETPAEAIAAWNRRSASNTAGALSAAQFEHEVTQQTQAYEFKGGPNGEWLFRCDEWFNLSAVLDAPASTTQLSQVGVHSDDIAVDRFAAMMKAKLKWEREERGRGGWEAMSEAELSTLLIEHMPKGDPVDVANFCMMLALNNQRIRSTLSALPAGEGEDVTSEQVLNVAGRIQSIMSEKLSVDEGEIVGVGPCSYKIARLFKPAPQSTPPASEGLTDVDWRAEAERLKSALVIIAHTETENSFGDSRDMPSSWYRDQARAALSQDTPR